MFRAAPASKGDRGIALALLARIPGLRERMGDAAIQPHGLRLFNAGTVEFLADNAGNFYFLE